MRKGYADYGLTEERAKSLMKECIKGEHADMVRESAYQAAPNIAQYLIVSLTQGKSYDRIRIDWELGRIERMAYGRTDFYGYRRRTLAILDGMLTGKGRV